MGRKELSSNRQDDVIIDGPTMPIVREDMVQKIKQGIDDNYELPSVEQPKQRTIQNISLMELKALAFDALLELEQAMNRKNVIDEELARRSKAE